jgi:cob(I)alamin adenosyltransferase
MPKKTPKSKLYTGAGDAGETGLFGGARVPKSHLRVRAYGHIDELNSTLGVAAAFLGPGRPVTVIESIQNDLLNIGSELASESGRQAEAGRLFSNSKGKVAALERQIDEYDAGLPRLRTFILPSGSRAGSLLHLARTVCRRAERAVVELAEREPVNEDILTYVNRLSDLLFVLARHVNRAAGKPETTWHKE